jgi:16S rRNA (cytosine1402-N4)-methyltransferase
MRILLPRRLIVKNDMDSKHDSVMMKELMSALVVKADDTVVDATIGGAGHFRALCSALGENGVIVGIDADTAAVERGREAYAEDRRPGRPIAHIVNDNFRNLSRILSRLGVGRVDAILFDLGWSGYQIASPRGFSFMNDEPLLMTYGEGAPANRLGTVQTAADIVNSSSETELSDIIFTYGEERFARRIAHAIVKARSKNRILTTGALVAAVKAGTPLWYHNSKTHPATKTFQAIRIFVNDEIGALREGLSAAIDSLAIGGRLAVISFHSIEDRIVKKILRDAAESGLGKLEPKKAVVPTRSEIQENRRARSAKMRVFERSMAYVENVATKPLNVSYA